MIEHLGRDLCHDMWGLVSSRNHQFLMRAGCISVGVGHAVKINGVSWGRGLFVYYQWAWNFWVQWPCGIESSSHASVKRLQHNLWTLQPGHASLLGRTPCTLSHICAGRLMHPGSMVWGPEELHIWELPEPSLLHLLLWLVLIYTLSRAKSLTNLGTFFKDSKGIIKSRVMQ